MIKPTRSEIEDFLHLEAELLDTWDFDGWAALFTLDGRYYVPALDAPEGSPASTLYLINDDHFRLSERGRRILKRRAHAEFPRSRTQHSISNVKVTYAEDGDLAVACHFVVYRSRREILDVFPGRSYYELVQTPDRELKIRSKKAVLTLDVLRPHGKLSIIL